MNRMPKPTETRQRALWVAYFILGVAFPLIFWGYKSKRDKAHLQKLEEAHDTTLEDSFPASDPPSAW